MMEPWCLWAFGSGGQPSPLDSTGRNLSFPSRFDKRGPRLDRRGEGNNVIVTSRSRVLAFLRSPVLRKGKAVSKDSLGEFEALVLLAALRLGEHAYGLSIAEEIEATASRPTARAAVYVTLRRLETKGLISTERESGEAARGGSPRRLVSVRPQGLVLLKESKAALQRMWAGLETILGET